MKSGFNRRDREWYSIMWKIEQYWPTKRKLIGRQREMLQLAARLMAYPTPMKTRIAEDLILMQKRIRPYLTWNMPHPDSPTPKEEDALIRKAQHMLTRRRGGKRILPK